MPWYLRMSTATGCLLYLERAGGFLEWLVIGHGLMLMLLPIQSRYVDLIDTLMMTSEVTSYVGEYGKSL